MAAQWSLSVEDVELVLQAHQIELNESKIEELFNDLDQESISDVMEDYTDGEDQQLAAHSDIEDQLMNMSIIPNEKLKQFQVE